MNTTIICPHCKKPVEISDAIQHQIEDELNRAKTEQSETLRREYEVAAETKLKQAVQSAVAEAEHPPQQESYMSYHRQKLFRRD